MPYMLKLTLYKQRLPWKTIYFISQSAEKRRTYLPLKNLKEKPENNLLTKTLKEKPKTSYIAKNCLPKPNTKNETLSNDYSAKKLKLYLKRNCYCKSKTIVLT